MDSAGLFDHCHTDYLGRLNISRTRLYCGHSRTRLYCGQSSRVRLNITDLSTFRPPACLWLEDL